MLIDGRVVVGGTAEVKLQQSLSSTSHTIHESVVHGENQSRSGGFEGSTFQITLTYDTTFLPVLIDGRLVGGGTARYSRGGLEQRNTLLSSSTPRIIFQHDASSKANAF